MKLTINNMEFALDNYTITDELVTCTYRGADYNTDNLFAINNITVTSASIQDETTTDLSEYNHSTMEFVVTTSWCDYTIYLTKVLLSQ